MNQELITKVCQVSELKLGDSLIWWDGTVWELTTHNQITSKIDSETKKDLDSQQWVEVIVRVNKVN